VSTIIGNRQKVVSAVALVAREGTDEGPDEQASDRPEQRRGLQQRFEDTHVGRVVVGVLIAVVLFIGIVWNLPDSPITRALIPAAKPVAAAIGLDRYWGMYGTPDTRVESVEVQVKMANGETRIWSMQPGGRGVGWWDRWILLRRAVISDASVRPQLAHWVVGQVAKPSEKPVDVTVLFRTENLSAPGEAAGGRAPATKILYQETLAGPS
jgi:hypothetical protein